MNNLFGTDGIRGRAGQYPLDLQTIFQLGKALVIYLRRRVKARPPRLVVARDTRISGLSIEAALTESLLKMGSEVYLLGVLPTPAVPILSKYLEADCGVMITASHNPYFDNGIKLFNANGMKLSLSEENEISALLVEMGRGLPVMPMENRRKRPGRKLAFQFLDSARIYRQSLMKMNESQIDQNQMKISIDCAHGAASDLARDLFLSMGVSVTAISSHPDGTNINDRCGALHPEGLVRSVVETNADFGLALDGDGDRSVFVDENGVVLSGDEVFGICAIYGYKKEELLSSLVQRPQVVSTVLANIGLEMALFENGISLVRTPVGDRNVVEKMLETSSRFGGEPSGHYIFLNHASTGDGLLTAIQMLGILKNSKRPLSLLKRTVRLLPQIMVDVPVKNKTPFESHQEISNKIESIEKDLQHRGRILVRYSGTESVARVMLEGEDSNRIQIHCQDMVQTLTRHLNL